jgi:hypothetical protein
MGMRKFFNKAPGWMLILVIENHFLPPLMNARMVLKSVTT